jgi:hypothetical protein
LYYYILIPLHAATILVGQAVSPVIAGSSRRFGCGYAALRGRIASCWPVSNRPLHAEQPVRGMPPNVERPFKANVIQFSGLIANP